VRGRGGRRLGAEEDELGHRGQQRQQVRFVSRQLVAQFGSERPSGRIDVEVLRRRREVDPGLAAAAR
jgi:hypothetical protein